MACTGIIKYDYTGNTPSPVIEIIDEDGNSTFFNPDGTPYNGDTTLLELCPTKLIDNEDGTYEHISACNGSTIIDTNDKFCAEWPEPVDISQVDSYPGSATPYYLGVPTWVYVPNGLTGEEKYIVKNGPNDIPIWVLVA